MTHPSRFGRRRRLLLTIVTLLGLGLLFFAGTVAFAAPVPQTTETPPVTVTPTFDLSRLDEPVTADPPGQIDRGAVHYWGVCMACHGDYGQGLIPAWRDAFGEDKDCWQSNCHGSDHPPEGFRIYKDNLAPALTGPGKLARFSNAFELYDYIYETMPWWNPGSITREEAWALANYVLKLNGTQPEGLVLTITNGYAIPVHRAVALPEKEWPGALALAGIFVFAAIGMVLQAFPKSTDSAILLPKPNFIHHLHPPSIPALQSRFRYTLGAGGIAVFLSLILLVTGLLEMYFYVPSPDQAATSVQVITTLVPYGNLVRNLHYWSAQLLLVVITIHLLRVVLTGAYAKPRRFNFLLGLALLVIILLLDFTGYILRWDEGIRWALVVGTNLLKTIPVIGEGFYQFMMGGPEAGPATLTRFYTWHIFGLAIGAAILVGWHAFRVRRDGGVAVPPPTERTDKTRITRFELLHREVLAMIIVGIVLLLFAVFIPAPIDQPISGASIDTSDSRAPWFFLWVQQLLKYGDPFIWGVLVPLLVVLGLGLIPYVLPKAKTRELGRWFPRGNRIAQVVAVLVVVGILVLTIISSLPTSY
ncbi:MAG: cytochrome b N-terminal domain-containing protein [Anaerolineales bacterium]|jgi:quinol-cytochrome oxidoreductase complex cytochrome b subunit/mono/diheme cytochrome c family protein